MPRFLCRPLQLCFFAVLLAAATTHPVSGGNFRYLSVPELTEHSDGCVVGTVVDSQVGWNEAGTIIVTTYTLALSETLAGEERSGMLTLTRVGGEIDGLALGYQGMPTLDVGETAAVFLLERSPDSFIIAGTHQGVFHQREGSFERSLRGVDGSPAPVERLHLDDLRESIASAERALTHDAGRR